jgi:ABC-type Fe3+/spermidine/putrescine transport system ATPase subunit
MSALTDKGAAQTGSEPVLRVRGLTKIYGAARVVDGISFDVDAGAVLTLLGPSGCGKSTTLRLIAGLEQPDAGEIWIRGRLVASPAQRVMVPPEQRKVGLVFQSYAVWPHMTVAENIGYPLKMRRIDRGTVAARVAEMLGLMKLEGLGGRMPTELSGGQQQRVALARALVYRPELLLLDEPLSNLDSVLRREMRSQLKELQSRLSTTVIYVTHDQEEAMSLSSRVAVLNRGVVEQIGPPDAVYEQPATPFVQDFVGRTIKLRGMIAGDAERLRVRVGSRTVEAGDSNRGTFHPGTAVEVSMRPEDVLLHTESDPGTSNCLVGNILEVTYYGDRCECTIRIDGTDEQVVVSAKKRLGAAAGDRIFLSIDGARLKLWPA